MIININRLQIVFRLPAIIYYYLFASLHTRIIIGKLTLVLILLHNERCSFIFTDYHGFDSTLNQQNFMSQYETISTDSSAICSISKHIFANAYIIIRFGCLIRVMIKRDKPTQDQWIISILRNKGFKY